MSQATLQVLKAVTGPEYILVSGSGSKSSAVWHGRDTLFACEREGFMEVDVLDTDGVFLRVFIPEDKTHVPRLLFSMWLRRPQHGAP